MVFINRNIITQKYTITYLLPSKALTGAIIENKLQNNT